MAEVELRSVDVTLSREENLQLRVAIVLSLWLWGVRLWDVFKMGSCSDGLELVLDMRYDDGLSRRGGG